MGRGLLGSSSGPMKARDEGALCRVLQQTGGKTKARGRCHIHLHFLVAGPGSSVPSPTSVSTAAPSPLAWQPAPRARYIAGAWMGCELVSRTVWCQLNVNSGRIGYFEPNSEPDSAPRDCASL